MLCNMNRSSKNTLLLVINSLSVLNRWSLPGSQCLLDFVRIYEQRETERDCDICMVRRTSFEIKELLPPASRIV